MSELIGASVLPDVTDLICVTNRYLCKGDFLTRIEEIAKHRPAGIILREKDLSEGEYRLLAEQALEICKKYDILCILHTFTDVAVELRAKAIHLPLPVLRSLGGKAGISEKISTNLFDKEALSVIGASCHSAKEAMEAEKLGCTYITAGHIFATDCKKGLPPRGIPFLEAVCHSVSIPVYAIGGIDERRMSAVRQAGAAGGCVMSALMCCEDIASCFERFTANKWMQNSHAKE